MPEYVDKNVVVNLVNEAIKNCKWHVAECTIDADDADLKALRDKVMKIPPDDVAPVVHARWVHEDVDWVCSNCGMDALTEGDYRQVRSDYCPNCGARMDGDCND